MLHDKACAMATGDDERFRVKPGAPKHRDYSRGGRRAKSFVSQVLTQISKAGAQASNQGQDRGRGRPASTFGRGRVAAVMAGQRLGAKARRVIIKSRFVVLKKAGAKSVSTHLRYIQRDGVTRDGQPGQAYGAEADTVDIQAFEERGKGHRHQFRFIVSVEDAETLEDLRGYTRELMRRVATDLETELDWVAVDHWDTDNPHTHIVLTGRASNGQDLVIAPDYMAHGMRLRANELATEMLGPRTDREIREGLLREVEQERLTSLDRALLRRATLDVLDLTQHGGDRQHQALLRTRLQHLEAMQLARRMDSNHWQLSPDMEKTLVALCERSDIMRTMHRAIRGEPREFVLDAAPASSVVGRVAAKGLADELNDRGYLVIDGIDGRAHYLRLPPGADLAALPVGGIVEAVGAGRERPVDRNIAAMVRDGLYRSADHLAQLRQQGAPDPKETVIAHVHRLEALRRARVVDRVVAGVWRVPPDFLSRAQAHDSQRSAGLDIRLRSHLPIEQQVRAHGATWLDQRLVDGARDLAPQGFGAQVRGALRSRTDFLVELGLAERCGERLALARNLLATLRHRELLEVGKLLQDETGRRFRPAPDGAQVSGVYRRSVQLVSGRFAMLDDGMGFRLVPWRPVLEQRLGQHVSAIVRGSLVSWNLERQLGR